ncbi:hypothetical protein JCM17961_37120 [Endothiovibrio diazotrophicus]
MAIVATVIATAAMAARLAADRLERAEGLLERQRAVLSLKDRIALEPLFTVHSGEGRWARGPYRWQAKLLESGSERRHADAEGGGAAAGLFEVGLFQLTLTLQRADGGEYRYGWRAVNYRLREDGR